MFERGYRLAVARSHVAKIAAGIFGVDVLKALDPLNGRDFEIIIARLGKKLNVASVDEEKALRKAIDSLDVDWPSMTKSQQDDVFVAAAATISLSAAAVVGKVDKVLGPEGRKNVGATKRSTSVKFKLELKTGFDARDREVMKFNRFSQGNFVTNEIGVRSKLFDRQARGIVSDGLGQGLGRKDIVDDLEKKLSASGLARKRSYYNVVAASFSTRSRTWGQLSSYSEAVIRTYFIESVIDEVTTDICRFMHGRRFNVETSIKLFRQAETLGNPQDLKEIQPWVRNRRGEDGENLLQINQGGEFQTVARVLESAVGQQDAIGRFSQQMSEDQLISAGVMVPPFHGGCRTLLVPDF